MAAPTKTIERTKRVRSARGIRTALLCCLAGAFGFQSANATTFPPGSTGTCLDSVTLYQIQNPTAACHPTTVSGASADTVYGVGGIVTGFDKNPTGYSFYFQNNGSATNGTPWEGIDVFTEGVNLSDDMGLQIGDSVVVTGKLDEFGGGSEIRSLDRTFGTPNGPIVRKVSSGNHVPNTHVGTCAELQQLITNPNAEQWEGSLVQISGPLRVVRVSGTNPGPPPDTRHMGLTNSWLVVDNTACPNGSTGPCDSVYIDGLTCSTPFYVPPPVGTIVDMVRGLYDQRGGGDYVPAGGTAYHIQLRGATDVVLHGTQADPTITATADAGGSISPSGSVTVPYGSDEKFTITPADKCHVIADVVVNGMSVGAVGSYTFHNVVVDGQTIHATFALLGPFTITATAATGVSISPSGAVSVACGASQTFSIVPDDCHVIGDVKVDGVSVGPVTSYTFDDVQANHTIAAFPAHPGPVIVGGDDMPKHGYYDGANHLGWLYMQKALDQMYQGGCITRANDGSVAALGVYDPAIDGYPRGQCPGSGCPQFSGGSAIHFAATVALGKAVNYYEGSAGITQFFADLASGSAKPAIIWICSKFGDLGNEVSCSEIAVVNAHAADLATFVNSGGGLMAHTGVPGNEGCASTWLGTVVPGLGEVGTGAPPYGACAAFGASLTPAGSAAFPGLSSSDINSNLEPCHSHFEGWLGSIEVLALDGGGRNFIIGAGCCGKGFQPTIVATAGPGGSISPNGPSVVPIGGSQKYTSTPSDKCHTIATLKVDGVSIVPPLASYTFTNVQANHTIDVTFALLGPFKISASAGSGGSISPSGSAPVVCGGTQSFQISPADKCHFIADVKVDGASVGAVTSYDFGDVQANHTITATFGVYGPFTITATASAGGSIDPSGAVSAPCGSTSDFTFSPSDKCRVVTDVKVNGASITPTPTSYQFTDVQSNQTIQVTFGTRGPFHIVATAHAHGAISPSGNVSVPCGANQSFDVLPDAGYVVDHVDVDGQPAGLIVFTYIFNDVQADHTIDAYFVPEARIEGAKFWDLNRNGTNNGEPAIRGYSIRLTGPGPQTLVKKTDNLGHYAFTGLTSGTYVVDEILRNTKWLLTAPTSPTFGRYTVTVSSGQTVTGKDFGNDSCIVDTACAIPPRSMRAWWRFEEAGGTISNDEIFHKSKRSRGDLIGGASWTYSEYAGVSSLHLDGSGTQYVNVPVADQLNPGANGLAIDAWIRTTASFCTIVDKRSKSGSFYRGYSFFVINGQPGLQLANGQAPGNGASNWFPPGTGTLSDGNWHHVAVSVDLASQPPSGRFYVDGQSPPAYAFQPDRTGNLGTTASFRIGQSFDLSSPGFNGDIDELEFFATKLDGGVVSRLYQAGQKGKCIEYAYVPSVTSFPVSKSSVVVHLTICNKKVFASETYRWSMSGLPIGPGCDVAGPTQFSPPGGLVTVPYGTCKSVDVTIQKPPGLAGTLTSCFAFTVGTRDNTRHLPCFTGVGVPRSTTSSGGGGCCDVWTTALSPDLTHVPTTGGTVQFNLQNLGATPVAYSYRLRDTCVVDVADAPDYLPLPRLSLNDQLPGVPVTGQITIPAGDSVLLGVNVKPQELLPFTPMGVVLEHDLDGDGAPDPVAEIGVEAEDDSTGGILSGDEGPFGTSTRIEASPNPFRYAAVARFSLEASQLVRIRVFDVNGRLVRSLRDGLLTAGKHSVEWDGRTESGEAARVGIYFIRVSLRDRTLSAKVVRLQ